MPPSGFLDAVMAADDACGARRSAGHGPTSSRTGPLDYTTTRPGPIWVGHAVAKAGQLGDPEELCSMRIWRRLPLPAYPSLRALASLAVGGYGILVREPVGVVVIIRGNSLAVYPHQGGSVLLWLGPHGDRGKLSPEVRGGDPDGGDRCRGWACDRPTDVLTADREASESWCVTTASRDRLHGDRQRPAVESVRMRRANAGRTLELGGKLARCASLDDAV